MMARDYYSILGLDESATESEIESAYKRLSAGCSPENGHTDSESKKIYDSITEAYQVLSDMDRRAAYDIRGEVSGIKRRKGSAAATSPVIKAREILNKVFLCGAAVSAILFVIYLTGYSPLPFYIVCGISLFLKVTEYLLRLIQ